MGREYTIEEAIITVDKEQIKQVLMNLLLNAVQAVEGEGRIDVCTAFVWEQAKDGDRLRLRGKKRAALVAVGENDKVRQFEIRISDTGCGISEDDLKHLFNPFFTTKPEGTGLGLAISHVIVQEHNGTLDAESEPGRGATFTLRLPATDGL